MMSAPLARTSSGRTALTVAAVPTGMKAGVLISPRSVVMTPVRAAPSVAAIEKEKRVTARDLVQQYLTRIALYDAKLHATITVNTNIPKINPDGLCSLIEAIVNANDDAATHADCAAGSGADVIELAPASIHTVATKYVQYHAPLQ